MGQQQQQSPSITTIIYVVGEVVISLTAMIGALYVLITVPDQGVKLTASGLLSAVSVFWFTRRQAEQANNNMAMLADGKLTQLLQSQQNTNAQQQQLLTVMAGTAQSAKSASESAASSAQTAQNMSTGTRT